MSTTLKYWDDTGGVWVPFKNDSNAYSSIRVKESVTGLINGTNTTFTTTQGYIAGSLQVFVNGLAQSGLITETTPASGIFDLDTAPETGDDIKVYYHINSTPLGNADAIGGYSLTGLLESLYPVGAIYTSGSSTMPALISGLGTWVRIEGKFIVGASDSDTDFDVGDTGGAKDVTLTEAQIPSHRHVVRGTARADSIGVRYSGNGGGSTNMADTTNSVNADTYTGQLYGWYTGGDGAHENLPPYEAIYMWKRSA